jgi:hypothetical protein
MISILALTATATLIGLVVFQLALIAGAPLGKYAWGGTYTKLPTKLRIASSTSLALYGVFAAFILSKAGILPVIINTDVLNAGMWIFTVYFFLGIFLNGISRSTHERNLMTPIAAVLAVLFLLVALS